MKPVHAVFDVMFTRMDVLLFEEQAKTELLLEEIKKEIYVLEKLFNRFDPESELSGINRAETQRWIPISDRMKDILELSLSMREKTLGYFDVACDNSVRDSLSVDHRKGILKKENLLIDLGGIAKGYSLDCIEDILRKHSVGSAFVSFGESSVLAWGTHPYGDYWPVGAKDFFSPEQVIWPCRLRGQYLSGSSTLQRRDRKYKAHIVNPFSRTAISEHRISSVVTIGGAEGEALSTALIAADTGIERKRIMANFPEAESCVCIYQGEQMIEKVIYGKQESFEA